mmetsp:Transcript_32809/g.85173  ORF Transcript_32809/g.85173 Transcript_32809/m.85173 type:complete len:85 (-) Transcript_32809:28-282(-)
MDLQDHDDSVADRLSGVAYLRYSVSRRSVRRCAVPLSLPNYFDAAAASSASSENKCPAGVLFFLKQWPNLEAGCNSGSAPLPLL